jgi:nicotinate-nucleotide adenylyltransferase
VRLGIFGGSFDPPHLGHVLLASYALASCEIDELLVIPVYQHALGKELTASFEQRLRMCELAFADLRRLTVSPLERELGGTSRTLRLIEALEKQYDAASFRLVIGADILHEVERWQAFDEIARRAPLFVAGRAGTEPGSVDERTPVLPDISSTELRALLSRGEDPGAWLPRRVHDYVRQHGLYAAAP